MSEEQTWLISLSMDQLVQACRVAGVKVDGFRHLAQVPRLLLERQVYSYLSKHRGHARSTKLRSALVTAWRERFPALAGLLKEGPGGTPEEERPEADRWVEWLAGLGRTFGRAPVQMGLHLTEIQLPLEGEVLTKLEPYWLPDAPLTPAPTLPAVVDPTLITMEEQEEEAAPLRPEWRQERTLLRAKLKGLTQEIQTLQRARTSAEHRAAHYQAQVEQVREELDALAHRTNWPHPTMLVQRLIRGLMDARRQILDLEVANTELRAALGQVQEVEAEPDESERMENP